MTADGITVFGATDLGRERSNNEDAFLVACARTRVPIDFPAAKAREVVTDALLLAVADGMGGHNAGEVASALTTSCVADALATELVEGPPDAALRTAIARANVAVTAAASRPDRQGMGSTLVTALLDRDQAYIATVGDSRAYVLRRGELLRLTRDQTFVQDLIDRGTLSQDEIAAFPYRNMILQAIGQAPSLRIPVGRLALRRDDVLLLCSDGLTAEVDDPGIRDILSQGLSIDEACRQLIAAANERGGHDNITVVLACVHGERLAHASPNEPVAESLESVPSPPPSGD